MPEEVNKENPPVEVSAGNPPKTKDPDVEENKFIAYLSYIGILCLVPLLGKKDSKFAQFHAKQGLVICALEIVISVMWFFPLAWLIMIGLIALSAYAIYQVNLGQWWKIPLIYDWSKKINL